MKIETPTLHSCLQSSDGRETMALLPLDGLPDSRPLSSIIPYKEARETKKKQKSIMFIIVVTKIRTHEN